MTNATNDQFEAWYDTSGLFERAHGDLFPALIKESARAAWKARGDATMTPVEQAPIAMTDERFIEIKVTPHKLDTERELIAEVDRLRAELDELNGIACKAYDFIMTDFDAMESHKVREEFAKRYAAGRHGRRKEWIRGLAIAADEEQEPQP